MLTLECKFLNIAFRKSAVTRSAGSYPFGSDVPGVRCAHPGLYAFVRSADFFRPSRVVAPWVRKPSPEQSAENLDQTLKELQLFTRRSRTSGRNQALALLLICTAGAFACGQRESQSANNHPAAKPAGAHNFKSALKQSLTGHAEEVWAVAFSADGKTLASGGDDATVKLWDVPTGKEKQTLTGHKYKVTSVAFSPDGKMLASGSEDYTVKVWDVASGGLKQTLNHDYQVTAIAFSPDGASLATAVYSGNVLLWDAQTWTRKQEFSGKEIVHGLAFSPDSRLVASGAEKAIKIWNAQSGETQMLSGHTSDVRSVCFSPDGQTLASAGDDRSVILWDLATAKPKQTLTGAESSVYAVAFSPDGRTIASGGLNENKVRLWDARTGAPKTSLEGEFSYSIYSVAFSPDGGLLAAASADKTVKLWE